MKNILIISESVNEGPTFVVAPAVLQLINIQKDRHKICIIAPFLLPLPCKKKNIKIILKSIKILKQKSGMGAPLYRPCFFGLPYSLSRSNDYLRVILILIYIKLKKIKVDIIHAHYAHPPGFVGVLLSKILQKPMVLTCHGSDIHQYTDKNYPDKLRRRRVIYSLKNADYVIAVSSSLKEKIVQLGISSSKVEAIVNGVNNDIFYPMDKETIRKKLGLEVNKKIMLNIGFFLRVKGTSFLISALSNIIKIRTDLLLIIIGIGPLELELKRQVGLLGLSKFVLFLGFISHKQIPFWINAADLFVLPSLDEGFGMGIIESLACGVPVVASSVGGIPGIIHNENIGLLAPPANERGLSLKILQAIDKKWDVSHLIHRSRDFSWVKSANQLDKLYERLMTD